MYGNAIGWMISAMIVVATVAAIAYVQRVNRPTPADAFGLDPQNAAPLSLPAPTPVAMNQSGDAAALYRSAIEAALRKTDLLESFIQRGGLSDLTAIEPLLDPLRRAAPATGAAIFAPTPGELINYRNTIPSMNALELLAKAGLRAALVTRETDPKYSAQTLEAVFALGHRLYTERLTYAELDLGLRLMAESAAGLKRLATDSGNIARQNEVEGFDAERLTLVRSRILPIAGRIRTMDGRMISANAGNIIRWAKDKDADRVWRVEATLALGRMRFSVGPQGTLGDQRAARRALEVLSTDPDPLVQLAVQAALDLSAEEYRLLR